MTKCEKVKSQLVELVYDELSAEERDVVEVHLDSCPACRSEWQRLLTARRWLNILPDTIHAPPPESRYVYHVLRARVQQQRRSRRWYACAALAAAALVLLALAAGLRLEIHGTHLVVDWGHREHRGESGDDAAAIAVLSERLDRHEQRLSGVEELSRLVVREVMAIDERHLAGVAELREQRDQVVQLDRRLSTVEEQSAQAWQLVAREVLRQGEHVTALAAKHRRPGTDGGDQTEQ